MNLNLPIFPQLATCKNLLIAGMGGGFDIFCGLPIYFELRSKGYKLHLANLTFSNVAFSSAASLKNTIKLTETLVGVTHNTENIFVYFPELYLSKWFHEKQAASETIWCFKVTGVQTMLHNYRLLIDRLAINGILLVDGGVDSLIRGDESQLGTVIEDAITLAAVSQLNEIPVRLITCLAFGAERDLNYAEILENISALAKEGGFLGSCSLVKQMQAYQDYENALLYVQSQQYQDSSVINSSVVSAVQGHYGDYHLTEKTKGSTLWISPFMPIYWFFDLQAVVKSNMFLSQLLSTNTFSDVVSAMAIARKDIKNRTQRKSSNIPL